MIGVIRGREFTRCLLGTETRRHHLVRDRFGLCGAYGPADSDTGNHEDQWRPDSGESTICLECFVRWACAARVPAEADDAAVVRLLGGATFRPGPRVDTLWSDVYCLLDLLFEGRRWTPEQRGIRGDSYAVGGLVVEAHDEGSGLSTIEMRLRAVCRPEWVTRCVLVTTDERHLNCRPMVHRKPLEVVWVKPIDARAAKDVASNV